MIEQDRIGQDGIEQDISVARELQQSSNLANHHCWASLGVLKIKINH